MRHSKYMNSVWNDSTLNLVLFELQELETQILDGLPSKIEQIISNLDDLSCSVGSFALQLCMNLCDRNTIYMELLTCICFS